MRMARIRGLTVIAVLAAGVALVLAGAHLPPGRALALAQAISWLRSQGLQVSADSLSYNLLNLTFQLRGVSVTATGAGTPLLTARDVRADLPWSALFGGVRLDHVAVSGLAVSLVRQGDGSLNVPASPSGGPPLARLDLGRVRLEQASFRFDDVAAGQHVALDDVSINLSPGDGRFAGRLTGNRTLSLETGGVTVSGTLDGGLAYDGVNLTLGGLSYTSRLGGLRLDGRVGVFGPAPSMALRVEGSVLLDQVSRAFAVEPPAAGTVRFAGDINGPMAAPVATLSLNSDRIGWQQLEGRVLTAQAVATTDRLTVESAALQIGRGRLDASGQLTFDTLRATAEARWRDITVAALANLGTPVLNASRLSGRASLDATLAGTARVLTLDASVRADTGPAGPVEGVLALRATGPAWSGRSTLTLSGGTTAQATVGGRIPSTDIISHSTLKGSVTAASSDLARLALTATRLGLLDPAAISPEAGRATLTLQLAGTIAAPSARGALRLSEGRIAGVGPIAGGLTLAMRPNRFSADRIDVALGGNHVTGQASLSGSRGTLTGGLDLIAADFSVLGASVAAWRPSGGLRAHANLSGTAQEPITEVTVTGSNLAVAGQTLGELSAVLQASASSIALSGATLRQPTGGQLTATGEYDLTGTRHALTLEARAVHLSPVSAAAGDWPVSGTMDGSLNMHGTRALPAGGGRLTFTDLRWDDAHLEQAHADVRLSDEGVEVHLDAPALALTARAVIAQFEPYAMTVTAEAGETNVAALVRSFGSMVPPQLQQVTGVIKGRLTARGTPGALTEMTGEAALETLNLSTGDATLRLDQPAAARYNADRVEVHAFQVRTGTTTLGVTGGLGSGFPDGLALSLNGTLADFRPWMAATGGPAGLDVDGMLAITARATGTLDLPVVSGEARLTGGRLSWPGYPEVTGATTTLTLRDGVLDVPVLQGLWQEAVLDGHGRVGLRFLDEWLPARLIPSGGAADSSASVQVRLDNITPAVLAPFVDVATVAEIAGSTALEVDLRADRPALDRLTGFVLLPRLNLGAGGVPLEQVRPTRIEVVAGALRVAEWEWTLAGSPLGVTGTGGLLSGDALDLRVEGLLDLRVLRVLVPGGAADGTGELSMTIRGTMGAPVADGTIRLKDGELRLTEPRVGLSGATGAITLRPGRVEIGEIEGTLNGGRVALRGQVDYRDLRVTSGTITLDAAQVALDVPTGVRTEVNAALTLALADRVQLSGRVDVLQGAYREPLSLAAAIAATARQREPAVTGDAAASLLDRVDLNVTLTSSEDLAVDNNYGRLDLGLDLRLVGTAALPSVVGRAAIREGGVLYLGGRTYLITRGVIDFSDPRAIVPQLDLAGRTRVDGTNESGSSTQYDITLVVTGTPETLTTDLTSDPSLSQSDIVSLLATGRLADQIGGAGVAIARDQFIGYLSGETLGFAARAIGMDSIRFERGAGQDALASDASIAGEVNPAQRLTVTRRISGRAEVSVSQNLRDTGRLTWIAALTPRRAVELRAVSRDDTSRAYEVRHDVAFGGPAPPRSAPQQASAGRVTAVRITGEPGVPTGDVERRLHLKVGSRFDFYRWQQDRDRLRRFYLDRDHLEVRISARQVPDTTTGDAQGVALEYRITAGPRAAIEVEGDRLPGRLLRELERLWSDSLLDIGLLGDATAAVQAHLAGEGYLRARVRATRLPPDAASPLTRLRIRVARGARSATRTIEATGNHLLSDSHIRAAATALGVTAWLTPGHLADEIARLYRQQGHLAATVSAGPATYSPDGVVLPVRIQEGPPFTFGSVSISGARARPEDSVRKELALDAGTPYTPEALQAARQMLIRAYATEGFNTATVDARSTVDVAAASVDVGISIQEGLQQVVTDVVVTGADGVSPGVVTDALRLEPGAPAHLETLYAGRRRLFQTGLFSRADVEATPIPGAQTTAGVEPVRADVTLVRAQPWRLRYGVNVSDEHAPIADQGRTFGGGLSGMLERQGLFGRPGSTVASVRYNNDQRVVRGTLTWPTLFGRAITSRLYAANARDSVSGENILSFITDRTTVTAEQRFTVGGLARVAYAYQFERNHVFDPDGDPQDPFALDERWRQARLSSSLVLDTRANPIDPVRGFVHSSTVEYGLESLGRNGRFVKYSLQQLLFAPLATGVVSASAIRLNLGKGFGQDLILSERFLAGGTNTVRGYADDSLGGFDFFGDPIRGQATLVLNQEVRFPLARWIRGAAFIDAGNVFERTTDVSFGSLKVGGGAGLRLNTPVGLFRLDVATPLRRSGRATRLHLAFGHIF